MVTKVTYTWRSALSYCSNIPHPSKIDWAGHAMMKKEVSKSLLLLRRSIAGEKDLASLRQLVVEINSLLDLIEKEVAKLEGRGRRLPN